MVNYPVHLINVLASRQWNTLQNHLDNEGWLRNNVDYDPKQGVSWSQLDEQTPVYFMVGTVMSLQVQKVLKRRLKIVKIHVNGQTMGQMSTFHKDSNWDDVWTSVLFTNPHWNANHGGEFTLYDPIHGTYRSISYIPNSAALFPANWEHRGAPPLIPEAGMRTSLAVTYCAEEIQENFVRSHPALIGFSNYA